MTSTKAPTREYRPEPGPVGTLRRVTCQAVVQGRGMNNTWCMSPEVTKDGRYRLAGGWWDVWRCPNGHRFGVRALASGQRLVIDVPTVKAVFGG